MTKAIPSSLSKVRKTEGESTGEGGTQDLQTARRCRRIADHIRALTKRGDATAAEDSWHENWILRPAHLPSSTGEQMNGERTAPKDSLLDLVDAVARLWAASLGQPMPENSPLQLSEKGTSVWIPALRASVANNRSILAGYLASRVEEIRPTRSENPEFQKALEGLEQMTLGLTGCPELSEIRQELQGAVPRKNLAPKILARAEALAASHPVESLILKLPLRAWTADELRDIRMHQAKGETAPLQLLLKNPSIPFCPEGHLAFANRVAFLFRLEKVRKDLRNGLTPHEQPDAHLHDRLATLIAQWEEDPESFASRPSAVSRLAETVVEAIGRVRREEPDSDVLRGVVRAIDRCMTAFATWPPWSTADFGAHPAQSERWSQASDFNGDSAYWAESAAWWSRALKAASRAPATEAQGPQDPGAHPVGAAGEAPRIKISRSRRIAEIDGTTHPLSPELHSCILMLADAGGGFVTGMALSGTSKGTMRLKSLEGPEELRQIIESVPGRNGGYRLTESVLVID